MFLSTRDDRSRRTPIHWRGLLLTPDTNPQSRLWHTVLRTLATLLSRPMVLLALGLSIVLASSLAAARFGPIVIALILFSPIASAWIALLAMSLASTGEWFSHEARRVKALMLRQSRCPSCNYCLTGVEPAIDGCTVCPECSAAWLIGSPKYDLDHRTVVVIPSPPPPPHDEIPGDTPERDFSRRE